MFIDKMNRKQKRQFNKLSTDEQAPIIEAELIQKVSPIMAKEIANSMVNGMNILWAQLYNDFVLQIDAAGTAEEWDLLVAKLLSTIRKQYLRVEASKAKENKDEVS